MSKTPTPSQDRRDDLRNRIIDIAEAVIRDHGLAAVKARDLAAQAGCAVGAIYNVFTDLNGVVMAVNARTFLALGAAVAGALQGREGLAPTERLVVMAHAYLHFAQGNPRAWRTLFDLQMTTETVPDWYMGELHKLFAHIAAPLAELFPDRDREGIALLTRTLFSAVHGIVLLGLERRISGLPPEKIEEMIGLLLRNVASHS
jgi:AcrR family transcriptional regulator